MIILAVCKDSKEALSKARELMELYLKRHKKAFNGDVSWGLTGKKPNFRHELICRAAPELEKQMQELHDELYGKA